MVLSNKADSGEVRKWGNWSFNAWDIIITANLVVFLFQIISNYEKCVELQHYISNFIQIIAIVLLWLLYLLQRSTNGLYKVSSRTKNIFRSLCHFKNENVSIFFSFHEFPWGFSICAHFQPIHFSILPFCRIDGANSIENKSSRISFSFFYAKRPPLSVDATFFLWRWNLNAIHHSPIVTDLQSFFHWIS